MFLIGPVGPTELILCLLLGFFLPWIIALVDIVRSEFLGSNKIVWVIIVLLLPIVGAILYFFHWQTSKKQISTITKKEKGAEKKMILFFRGGKYISSF